MPRRYSTSPLLALAAAVPIAIGCHHDVTTPVVPLDLTTRLRSVDGAPLPVSVEERRGTANQLVNYTLTLQRNGLWLSQGWRRPAGAGIGDTSVFQDNGWYRFDGTALVLHSNLTHTDWRGTKRGDTITTTGLLVVADAAHDMNLWP